MEPNIIISSLKGKEQNANAQENPLNMDVVKEERKSGVRKIGHRGFDVISQKFFVEEQRLSKVDTITFDSFEKYYDFLEGDIYQDACYYQYSFSNEILRQFKLDGNKLKEKKCFVLDTIDNYAQPFSRKDMDEYNQYEGTVKIWVKQWIDRFDLCDTYEQFKKTCNAYEKSEMVQYRQIEVFLFQYIFCDQYSQQRFDIIMKYLSNDYKGSEKIILGLCLIYNPQSIFNSYVISDASDTRRVSLKKEIGKFVQNLENNDVEIVTESYFDKTTHFYCERTKAYCYINHRGRRVLNKSASAYMCRIFETFDEFIKYRNGDLKNCDLSGAIELDVDFSKYVTDDMTKLPLGKNAKLNYKIQKVYEDGKFSVAQFWYNEADRVVKRQIHTFSYFFDFAAFLKGDLSNANLIFCDGVKNLVDISEINLTNARLTSTLCDRFGILYSTYDYDRKNVGEFPIVERNEEQTLPVLQSFRKIAPEDEGIFEKKDNKITYISDLHLMHRIKNAGCKSKEDVLYVIGKIVGDIFRESSKLTLIGGDVSSEFSIFEMFVKMLRRMLDRYYIKRDFVFVLGNHELWSFPELSIEQIVEKYRKVLNENNMYLLHNELFYKNEVDDMGIIPYEELMQSDIATLHEKLKCTRLVILGGLGFSGYNEDFNAENGIYRETVDRETEIRESKKIENLYNKLIPVLERNNTIIFTHTPKKDWCSDAKSHSDFVYVSGHTHRNLFFDDGEERVYADNQIGYRNENIHLKSFFIDNEYDCFEDYEDGIYEITPQEYQNFTRGKNLYMTFNRPVNVLYMLKRNGYYCFIHKTKSGSLSILNGGALKKLNEKNIRYYYDNMEAVIATIQKPLSEYTAYQRNIAAVIRKIGGSGKIHGCIIDIDFYNHVYVNPIDLTVTAYWATDIINKVVYSNIPALLEAKCSEMYSNYQKLIEGGKIKALIVTSAKNEVSLMPQVYLETDIYRASREVKKLQKLSSHVLTTWYENTEKGE